MARGMTYSHPCIVVLSHVNFSLVQGPGITARMYSPKPNTFLVLTKQFVRAIGLLEQVFLTDSSVICRKTFKIPEHTKASLLSRRPKQHSRVPSTFPAS